MSEILSQEEIDNQVKDTFILKPPVEKKKKVKKSKKLNKSSYQEKKIKMFRGRTEVLSEEEIDALLTAINAGDTEPEDLRPACDTRKIKIYDFKRPDKFSKEQIRTISMMHETFARLTTTSLSAQLRSMVHVHVASVDQLTYEEFTRSVPTPTTLAIINMDPLKGNAILEIDPAVTFSIIDRLLGGSGEGTKYQHELTDLETSIMEGVIVRILGNLREAWTNVIDLRPRLGQIDTNPQFAMIVSPTEMVVLVTFEAKIGDIEGMINLCIPYITIESIITQLSTQYWFSPMHIIPKPNNVNVDNLNLVLKAEIGTTEITIKEFKELKIGDIIQIKDNYRLKINDTVLSNFIWNEKNKKIIEVRGINKYQERNYMEEKHNVLYEEGGLDKVKIQLICELGRTIRTMGEVKHICEGSIIELNKLAGEPIDIFANNVLIAKGEVVVIDENFGMRVVEILDPNYVSKPLFESIKEASE